MRRITSIWLCMALLIGIIPIYGPRAHAAAPANEPQLVAGYYHSVGLATDGTVWGWGGNEFGGLATGTKTNSSIPVAAKGMNDVASIAAGVRQSFAIKKDGTVWAWGSNNYGQLGDGSTTDRLLPVQIDIGDVAALSGGIGYHTLALKKDGTVWAWGDNESGELGDGTRISRSLPGPVPGIGDIVAVSAGGYHSIALKSDGTVWAWGLNTAGEMGNNTESAAQTAPVQVSGLDHVIAISAGNYHNLALKENGTVWAWGDNGQGRLGDGTATKRIVPVQVQGLSGVKAIAAGGFHSVALQEDGTVWAWGHNNHGQVGDGTTSQRNKPVALGGLSGVTQIAANSFSSAALREDGSVWSWGYGSYGQLGTGNTAESNIPVQSKAWLDGTPPEVSSGTIAASGITTDSVTLAWTRASDNMTGQAELEYRVYRSFKNSIQSVADIEAKGIAVNAYTADMDSLQLTGLVDGMPYYFNVIVKDKAGKKSAYTMQQVVTVAIPTYSVIYRGNGSTGGKVPVDDYYYYEGDQADIQGNVRGLVRAGYTFAGWNTAADGSGTAHAPDEQATIGQADLVLYAQWTQNPTYHVKYHGNGHTDGDGPVDGEAYEAGASVTVLGNTDGFMRKGYSFVGWNTQADGSGEAYAAGDTVAMSSSNLELYAQWTANPTYGVTYEAPDADSGAVPVDSGTYEEGAEFTVLGNTGGLTRAGYTFAGWTLAADGSGKVYQAGAKLTMGATAVKLYAKWTAKPNQPDPDPNQNPDPDPVLEPKLNALELSAGTWNKAFDAGTMAYTIALEANVSSLRMTAAAASDRQSISASVYDADPDHARLYGPVVLLQGTAADIRVSTTAASIQVVVTGEGGTARSYTLHIERQQSQPDSVLPVQSPTPVTSFSLTIGGTALTDMATAASTGDGSLNIVLHSQALIAGLAGAAEGTMIVISAPDIRSDAVTVQLDAASLAALQAKQAVLELRTAIGSYTLPLNEVRGDMGSGGTVRLLMKAADESAAQRLSQAALQSNLAVIASPVAFELAIVQDDRISEVVRFNSYVKRELALPAGGDPKGVTAVVVEADGTLRPVPTEIIERAGSYYAVVRSLTNSAYALVRPTAAEFADLAGHWAQGAVGELASRLIVNGYNGGLYRPNDAVSRAEFAAMLVRAMGLPSSTAAASAFVDLKAGAWYLGVVEQASSYALLRGDANGRFRPGDTLTREEAFTIVVRAMKLAGYKSDSDDEATESILSAYADQSDIHGWARAEAATAVQTGLIQGAGGNLRPAGQVTRAEAAAMLQRLLKQAGLINR